MKYLFLLAMLVTVNLSIYSQGIKPQNVYRVTVTSRYVVEDGERTSTFYAVNQEIFDSLGRKHTEIDYDWETRYPDNYRWHYYDSMEHVRTDYFINEELDIRKVFERDKEDRISKEKHLMVRDEDTVMVKSLEFSYNSSGLPKQIEALNPSGRRLYRIRSRFDEQGTEIRRRVRGRRGEPDDGIIRLDREAEYDSLGLLVSETIQLRMTDRNRKEYTRKYKYDEQQNITEKLELDDQGNQVSRTEYVWQASRNRLQRIIYYDADDNLEKYLAKRYEIYHTNDRRQRVIDY
ncbi:MAG: hypothetical protein ACLFQA_08425 [Bacteroidales bacterium]